MGDEGKKRWLMGKMNDFRGPAFRVNGGGYRCMNCGHILEPKENSSDNIESYYCNNDDCKCCGIEIPVMDAVGSVEAFDEMIQRLYG